ncbi:glycosyltransferase family 10 (fucosyltransferase) c-term domain-containing protein [Ditylenchus destructor]|nr:glycosyltransferase family 10 (fucosyltransferase) c-term domain-containing protein [Ditylenchus destructor]
MWKVAVPESAQDTCDADMTNGKTANKCPIIMAWTSFIANPMMNVLLTGNGYTNGLRIRPFNQSNCPYRCIYTDSRTQYNIEKASLMIFHIWINYIGNKYNDFNVLDLPPPNPNRLSVFFQTESVSRTSDSDIFFPYDTFDPVGDDYSPDEIWSEEQVNYILGRKSNLILVAMSHCNSPSGRDLYINKLAEYVPITQYGGCSSKWCSNECLEQEIEKHLFYLAFENSNCNYYHTEKFWRLKKLIVPIVLTRRTLKGLNVPDGAFIAADDFESPRKLADYILKLRNDISLYKKYFEWTKHYKKTTGTNVMCELCRLATQHRRQEIHGISKWWQKDGECDNSYIVDKLLKHY